MSHVVVLRSFDIRPKAEFGVILKLHRSVWIKTLPQIMNSLLQLGRTLSFLDDKDLG